MYIDYDCEAQTFTAYNLNTGQKMWVATEPTNTFWGYISAYRPNDSIRYTLCQLLHRRCICLECKTGKLIWDWSAGPSGFNNVYGSWPVKVIEAVGGGKLYVNGGHTYNPPLYRGSNLYCINATTGKEIWQILSFAKLIVRLALSQMANC